MKKLLTILIAISCAFNSIAQDSISLLCLVETIPPPERFAQPAIDLFKELGFKVTVEILSGTSPTSGYDVAVVGENVNSLNESQAMFSTAPMPLLVTKYHNVKPGGLNWGERGGRTADSVITIKDDHEVLKGLPDGEIKFVTGLPDGVEALAWVLLTWDASLNVIAEHPNEGIDDMSLVAINEGTNINGNVLENRAFIFALSGECFPYFTEDGKQLLSNIIHWLAGREIIGVESHNSARKVLVYPSPSSGKVKIKFDHTVSNMVVRVLGIDGKVLFSEKYSNTGNQELDLSGLHSGMYFIQLDGPDISCTERLILK
jgi:hypothetical protein